MTSMNKRTLTALEGSIKKWKNMVLGTGLDNGTSNCPLCHEFYHGGLCYDCPVALRSGRECCAGTPYEQFDDVFYQELKQLTGSNVSNGNKCVIGPRTMKAAIAEYEFLCSLLPK